MLNVTLNCIKFISFKYPSYDEIIFTFHQNNKKVKEKHHQQLAFCCMFGRLLIAKEAKLRLNGQLNKITLRILEMNCWIMLFFLCYLWFFILLSIRSNNLMKEKGVGIYNKHSSYACFHI